MVRLEQNSIEEAGVNPFDAPIPGEGMTNSPDNPKAWERPPEHSDEDTAMKELYLLLTEQDKLKELIKIIDDGAALDEIAQVILYKGYTEGKYNPDLMLLLIEPTIYLLISIADYAEIKDYVLYEGEDDDPNTEVPDDNIVPVDVENDDIPNKDINETFNIEERGVPDSSSIDSSLLSRIKNELPAKVKAATNGEV